VKTYCDYLLCVYSISRYMLGKVFSAVAVEFSFSITRKQLNLTISKWELQLILALILGQQFVVDQSPRGEFAKTMDVVCDVRWILSNFG